jgi:hypothetical protein
METIKIRTTERNRKRKLDCIAVYINGKQRFTLKVNREVSREDNHDIAALEAARVTAKKWGLLTKVSESFTRKEWELLKFQ